MTPNPRNPMRGPDLSIIARLRGRAFAIPRCQLLESAEDGGIHAHLEEDEEEEAGVHVLWHPRADEKGVHDLDFLKRLKVGDVFRVDPTHAMFQHCSDEVEVKDPQPGERVAG